MLETPEKQYVDDPSTVLKQLSLISRSIGHTMRLRPWILWLLLSSGGGATPSALLADDAIPAGSSWRYFKGRAPASTPGTLWRQKDFVDTSWTQGSSPFFYGEPFSGTALTDMQGGYSSVYLRRQFSTTDPGKTGSLVLHALSDDFLFDQEVIVHMLRSGRRLVERPVATHYGSGSRSISFGRSVRYGLGCVHAIFGG